MKNIQYIIVSISLLFTGMILSSCNDFLNILPKGEKIPTTKADFEHLFVMNQTI